MKKFWLFLVSFGFFGFVALGTVFAGGGRILIQTPAHPGVVGKYTAPVFAEVFTDNWPEKSVGERAEFRIDSPRPGDECITKQSQTDYLGMITAECSAKEPGSFSIYVYSFDRGDESSRALVYFVAPSPTPKPTVVAYPSKAPVASVTITSPSPLKMLEPTNRPEPLGGENTSVGWVIKLQYWIEDLLAKIFSWF